MRKRIITDRQQEATLSGRGFAIPVGNVVKVTLTSKLSASYVYLLANDGLSPADDNVRFSDNQFTMFATLFAGNALSKFNRGRSVAVWAIDDEIRHTIFSSATSGGECPSGW